MLAVLILGTTTILLFLSLVSVFVSQKHQLELEHNQTRNRNQQDGNLVGITADSQGKTYCLTPDCVKVAASVIEAIDLTVDPCDDFYVSSLRFETNFRCQLELSL